MTYYEKTALPNWMKILTYGLDKTEKTVLNVLFHYDYERVDCTDGFNKLIEQKVACIVINPDALNEDQLLRLNERYDNDYSSIILFTNEPLIKLNIPWNLVDLESDFDKTRKKAVELLDKAHIPSIGTINGNTVTDSGQGLSEGLILADVEITGIDPKIHEIVKLEAVRVVDNKIVDHFEKLVKIDRPMSLNIEEINGITNKMLEGAPSISETLADFTKWYPRDPLVYYNEEYTLDFIVPAAIKSGNVLDENRITIDLMRLAARIYPGYFINHTFQYMNLAKLIYGEETSIEDDCIKLEADLLIHLLTKLREDYGTVSVVDIMGLYRKEIM